MGAPEHRPDNWALALEDVGAVGPVLVAAVPAAQDIDVLVVVRARKVSGANHYLPVAVGVAWLGGPFAHSEEYIRPSIRSTRSLGASKPP